MHQTAIVCAAMILKPSGVSGELMQVARADVVMLASNHAAQA